RHPGGSLLGPFSDLLYPSFSKVSHARGYGVTNESIAWRSRTSHTDATGALASPAHRMYHNPSPMRVMCTGNELSERTTGACSVSLAEPDCTIFPASTTSRTSPSRHLSVIRAHHWSRAPSTEPISPSWPATDAAITSIPPRSR